MTNEALKEQFDLKNPYEIAKYIKAVEKTTPVKAFIKGYLRRKDLEGMNYFGDPSACIILGEAAEIGTLIEEKAASISFCKVEYDRRNSAIPLLDLTAVDARIEPGAFIREGVHIGKNAVVMMGAVINIGAEIGDGSMIDMNAVLGARAKVGKNCHIGAGAIGGAFAGMYGADFLCYLTPAEHLGLPNEEDVKMGVRSTKIAADCANMLRRGGKSWERSLAMSKARVARDTEAQIANSLEPEILRAKMEAEAHSDHCAACNDAKCPADVAAEFFGIN